MKAVQPLLGKWRRSETSPKVSFSTYLYIYFILYLSPSHNGDKWFFSKFCILSLFHYIVSSFEYSHVIKTRFMSKNSKNKTDVWILSCDQTRFNIRKPKIKTQFQIWILSSEEKVKKTTSFRELYWDKETEISLQYE